MWWMKGGSVCLSIALHIWCSVLGRAKKDSGITGGILAGKVRKAPEDKGGHKGQSRDKKRKNDWAGHSSNSSSSQALTSFLKRSNVQQQSWRSCGAGSTVLIIPKRVELSSVVLLLCDYLEAHALTMCSRA